MADKPPPELPPGWTSTLSGLSETFSFHASPESFITSRVAALQRLHPELFSSRAIVRARILNRDVAVVSSHAQIRHILEHSSSQDEKPAFVAAEAYSQFMGPFYPSPNLLMMDGAEHLRCRGKWTERMAKIETGALVRKLATEHFGALVGRDVSLYAELKRLCWKILLGLFLGLEETDAEFAEVERLQEELLRGQFSVFPVTINVGFWHSPRKRGKDAKEKLKNLILERIRDQSRCPFDHGGDETAKEEYANHLLMFSSSLAVKGLSSLLTAFLLNLFLFREGRSRLWDQIMNLKGDERLRMLKSIGKETQRVSPPIVGIMRRVTEDTVIPSPGNGVDILLPSGWDVWLYFVGGGRDPDAFGRDWARFVPGRYLDDTSGAGFAFSAGSKQCLGKGIMEDVVVAMGSALLDAGMGLEGEVDARGVRGWLGWEVMEGVADWERDVKQLPTQHPAKPVIVRIVKR